MAKQTLVYVHIYDKPRYVGEGTEHRASKTTRHDDSLYSCYSRKHSDKHSCCVIVGKFDNKVSACLQEQGMISWLGMRIRGEGPLLNAVPYTTSSGMPGTLDSETEKLRREKISKASKGKSKDKNVETRKNNGLPWHSEETKEKISKGNKGKVISENQKKKISKSLTGKTQSDETRKKRSESLKKSYLDRVNANAKCVEVIFLDGGKRTFESQSKAAEFFNVTAQGVARMIKTGKTRLKIKSIKLV